MTLKDKHTETGIERLMQTKKRLSDDKITFIRNKIKQKVLGDKPYRKSDQSTDFFVSNVNIVRDIPRPNSSKTT